MTLHWDHSLGSYDPPLGSHDLTLRSYDLSLGSHDPSLGSHDLTLRSHDLYLLIVLDKGERAYNFAGSYWKQILGTDYSFVSLLNI